MTALVFKDEGAVGGISVGPLYRRDENGALTNYEDSKLDKGIGPKSARWYTLREAREVAEREGIELELA